MIVFSVVLVLGAGHRYSSAAPLEFPTSPSGSLEITYPLDETLFPPDIVAPTVVWSDATAGVGQWTVLLKFGSGGEPLRFSTSEPRWRPSEEDWAEIKEPIDGARRYAGGCRGRFKG